MKQWPAVRAAESRAVWFVPVLLAAPFYLSMRLNHDSAWAVWVGRQMLGGRNLYSDIIEVNPPLWFWMTAVIGGALVPFFLLGIAASIGLLLKLRAERGLLAGFLIGTLLLPWGNFTQREHFTLIATVPYVLLLHRRGQGERIDSGLALAVGAFAAFGFALKPHFALVPLALELWLRNPKRPELAALIGAGSLYLVAALIFEPDFFTRSLPLSYLAYESFGRVAWQFALLPVLAPFLFAPFLKKPPPAFLIAALAFLLAFLAQGKGFAYQMIPALGMLTISALMSERKGVGASIAFMAVILNARPYTPSPYGLGDVPPGSSVAVLSRAPRLTWPFVEERHLIYTQPYMCLWMAPTVMPDFRGIRSDYLLIDDRTVNFTEAARGILLDYERVRQTGRITLYARRNGRS